MNYQFNLQKIKDDFEQVLIYSQGYNIDKLNIESIFDKWYLNKKFFIDKMGGKLIYTIPEKINFPLSQEEKEVKLGQFINFIDEFYNDDYYALVCFLRGLSTEEFFENKTYRERHIGLVTIPEGMKVLKAFKLFIEDQKILRDLQDSASRIIQENVITGYLCLSVHPLDFLSLSENNHNWRSCHALDGDYRGGNLSYMMDSTTVVCYLRSDRDEILPRFPDSVPWNSKKWRILLYFSQDRTMLFAGRAYPFSLDECLDYIRDTLLMRAGFGGWSSWRNSKIKEIPFRNGEKFYFDKYQYPVGKRLVSITDLIKNKKKALQYNDLIYSHIYTNPYYCYFEKDYSMKAPTPFARSTRWSNNDTSFEIGEAVPCVRCGQEFITSTNTYLCYDCAEEVSENSYEDLIDCYTCGMMEPYEDIKYTDITNVPICENCCDFREDELKLVHCSYCYAWDFDNVMTHHGSFITCPACEEEFFNN